MATKLTILHNVHHFVLLYIFIFEFFFQIPIFNLLLSDFVIAFLIGWCSFTFLNGLNVVNIYLKKYIQIKIKTRT